ncbi:hypothetical protein CKAH01_03108 [Colletotrichum kahawae]|uniref:Uncharacterized protein n=1 Tax=Colletotrichum kahawae TaxID=34407 RepID=A0AAE0DDH1_COLKA|nr:hypothetical protein CKAH01_03108 [Colletotrichum kahawae]
MTQQSTTSGIANFFLVSGVPGRSVARRATIES